jgi:hypothetical protein
MLRDQEVYQEVLLAITQESIGGNEMPVAKAKEFIIHGINETKLLPLVQVKIMTSEKEDIDRLTMAGRQTRKPTEGTAIEDEGAVTWAKQQLSSEECILAIPITFRAIKRNLERKALLDTIDNLAMRRFALDNEDLGINGDTDSQDPFLSQNDGWVKRGKSIGQTMNTNGLSTYQAILDALIFKLPEAYRDSDQNIIIMNDEDAAGLVNELGARVDGVSWLVQGKVPPWNGRPILSMAKWPKGVYAFTPSTNLAYGIEQRIEKGVDRYERARKLDMVYTCYQDYGVAVPEALAIAWDQGA